MILEMFTWDVYELLLETVAFFFLRKQLTY